jgi:two-component system NarL family sensor kinase
MGIGRRFLKTAEKTTIDDETVGGRREVRAAVARFLAAGVVALVLVATPVTFWIRAEAERHALATAVDFTQRMADNVVRPLITDRFLAGDPEAARVLNEKLAPWLAEGGVKRIKVWDEHSRVLYSDAQPLIGQEFEHEESVRLLLEGGPATVTLGPRTADENAFEAGSGELVEVYVRSTALGGAPMVFETYSSGDDVRREQQAVLIGMIPPMLLSLAVLQLAQLVPAARLARKMQFHQAARNALLRCAIDASDRERRQIASELHDEVIQDLSGLAYAMESEERRGAPAQKPVFAKARTMLQNNIRTLRAMTSELYPPDLEGLGLKDSLLRLQAPLLERGIALMVQMPDKLVLERDQAILVYRVAREALANTAKHSSAQTVTVSIRQAKGVTQVDVADDGRGFNSNGPGPEGHFGLRILGDTIRQAGGSLEVQSTPGVGTTVSATFGAAAPPHPSARLHRAASAGPELAGVPARRPRPY